MDRLGASVRQVVECSAQREHVLKAIDVGGLILVAADHNASIAAHRRQVATPQIEMPQLGQQVRPFRIRQLIRIDDERLRFLSCGIHEINSTVGKSPTCRSSSFSPRLP